MTQFCSKKPHGADVTCVGNRSSSHMQRNSAWWASDSPPCGKANLPLLAPSCQHSLALKFFSLSYSLPLIAGELPGFPIIRKRKSLI